MVVTIFLTTPVPPLTGPLLELEDLALLEIRLLVDAVLLGPLPDLTLGILPVPLLDLDELADLDLEAVNLVPVLSGLELRLLLRAPLTLLLALSST